MLANHPNVLGGGTAGISQTNADARYVINGTNPSAVTINAGGSNQNITATPSGTGDFRVVVGAVSPIRFGRNVSFTNFGAISLNNTLSDTGMIGFFGGGDDNFYFNSVGAIVLRPGGTGSNNVARINAAGATLLGTATDSANGRLQLAPHTTAAGGVGFGPTVSLFSPADDRLATPDLFQANGLSSGVTSTATAAATTTLTATSTVVQIFTGATTQTVQLPAANVLGANVGLWYVIKNRSSGNVTVQRAGADTIDGATTTVLATNDSVTLISDGSALWTVN